MRGGRRLADAGVDESIEKEYLEALARHRREKGHLAIEAATHAGRELCKWVCLQRERWRSGRLDPRLGVRLRKLGLPLEVGDCEWEQAFARVLRWRRANGRRQRPGSFGAEWIREQRELREAGRLRRDRETRLVAARILD